MMENKFEITHKECGSRRLYCINDSGEKQEFGIYWPLDINIPDAKTDIRLGTCNYCKKIHDLRLACPEYVKFKQEAEQKLKDYKKILFRKFDKNTYYRSK